MTAMSATLRARVLEAARATPARGRDELRRSNFAAVALTALITLGVFFAVGGFVPGARGVGATCASSAGWTLMALGATRLAVSRRASMLGLPTRALLGLAIAAGPVAFAWACATSPGTGTAPEWGAHATCLAATLALSAAPLAALIRARYRSDPVHSVALGASLGAASGLWGGAVIDLHCAVTAWQHLAVAHVLPVAVLAATGAALGRALLALR